MRVEKHVMPRSRPPLAPGDRVVLLERYHVNFPGLAGASHRVKECRPYAGPSKWLVILDDYPPGLDAGLLERATLPGGGFATNRYESGPTR